MIRLENLNEYKINRNIICIDLKSFYASVECVLRGLDPFKTPLVVADKERGGGSIVLAVSPYLKTQGVPSRCRIFELPQDIDIIYAKPQMQKYLEYSAKVVGVFLEFISDEDLYVYSIDETFLDVTAYLKYYNMTEEALAETILNRIYEVLGITAVCGIGPNMLMAKLAMDIEAKKVPSNIAKWDYKDLNKKLWNVIPISKMWGIGHRMEHHLNLLGLKTIGDIANYSKDKLKKRFGILGEELWYHTHGIDLSLIEDKGLLRSKPKSYGTSQVLFKDYDATEIKVIILEMVDELTRRLRLSKKRAKTITLSIGYSKAYHGGFRRQITLDHAANTEVVIYQACKDIFNMYDENYPIRKVGISLTKLEDSKIHQYSIFEDAQELEKDLELKHTIDKIKYRYGKNAITRTSALGKDSTAKARNKQIGGHHV